MSLPKGLPYTACSYFQKPWNLVSENLILIDSLLLPCGFYSNASGCLVGLSFPFPASDLGVSVNLKPLQM